MGYYSDVAIVVVGKKEELTKWLVAQRVHGRDLLGVWGEDITVGTLRSGEAILEFNTNCKWYPEFDDIRLWRNCLSDIDDSELDLTWEKLEVGEDGTTSRESGGKERDYMLYTLVSIDRGYETETSEPVRQWIGGA